MSLCEQECKNCRLGKGSFGHVFRAEYDIGNIPVAVKKLVAAAEDGMIESEMAILSITDNHPNILRYYCTEKEFLKEKNLT